MRGEGDAALVEVGFEGYADGKRGVGDGGDEVGGCGASVTGAGSLLLSLRGAGECAGLEDWEDSLDG